MLKSEILQSDWLRVSEAAAYAKMSRALVYELIGSSAIKSFLRKSNPANTTGTRLVSRASIDAWMNAQAEAAEVRQ
jgi:hypothetical protein